VKSICAFVFLVTVSLSVLAKQETVMIEIRGDALATPIKITDVQIVSQFNVWNGPGTYSFDANGPANPPSHLDPNKSQGRFVDWPKGIVKDMPANLRSFEVTFYLGHNPNVRLYPFIYAFSPTNNRGFVFLPLSTTGVIVHGVEENWFYASEKWDELISPLVVAAIQ